MGKTEKPYIMGVITSQSDTIIISPAVPCGWMQSRDGRLFTLFYTFCKTYIFLACNIYILYTTLHKICQWIQLFDILNIYIRIEDYQSWSNTSIWQQDRSGIFRFFSTSSCTTFYPSTEILWLLRMVLSWVSADCRQHTSLDCCSVCDDKWC